MGGIEEASKRLLLQPGRWLYVGCRRNDAVGIIRYGLWASEKDDEGITNVNCSSPNVV